jgi:oligopeptide transport system ATP-binding protein
MSDDKLLEVKNLTTIFRLDEGILTAVNGVSFSVGKEETVGIVGESGSGKSVANLSVLGLIPTPPGKIIAGEIFFEGKEILNIPESEKRKIRGKKISFIFQDPMTSLNPYLRISTQLTEGLIYHNRISKKEALSKAVEMLKWVGISEAEKKVFYYPHQFSGGMRQRVMIAMALLNRPKLLIADEPTTALDVTIQAQILELLKDLKSKIGLSLILITHNLGVVAGMADRILVMYAGFLVEENITEELFLRPKHPYTKALLKAIPRLDKKEGEDYYTIPGSPPNLVDLPDACPFHPRCDRAMDDCRKKMPLLEKIGETGRFACYHPIV